MATSAFLHNSCISDSRDIRIARTVENGAQTGSLIYDMDKPRPRGQSVYVCGRPAEIRVKREAVKMYTVWYSSLREQRRCKLIKHNP
jgi:hypothetical protein